MLIAVEPGAEAQNLHVDAGKHIVDFRQFGLETTISVMWAIDDFTATNGATAVCVGSRHWPRDRRPRPEESVPAVMPKGSCLCWTGDTWHGSGANTSARRRWALNIDYSVAWLRQEENQFLAVPPESAQLMPDELLTLIGYAQPSSSLGYVDSGRHPLVALRQRKQANYARGGSTLKPSMLNDWAQRLEDQPEPPPWPQVGGYRHLEGKPPVCSLSLLSFAILYFVSDWAMFGAGLSC